MLLADDFFLAYATEDIGLVARNKDAADTVKCVQLDLKLHAARRLHRLDFGRIADHLQDVFQAGNRANGHAHPIGIARWHKRRAFAREAIHQSFDGPRRIDGALNGRADDAKGLGGIDGC